MKTRVIEVMAWHPPVPGENPTQPADTSWHDEGLCGQVGADFFYPEKGESAAPAKRVCAACPVRLRCLEHALNTDELYGIWGGTTEEERRRIRVAGARKQNGLAA
jgi:WhiB family transcriptional regulator, redox-sensing transcriptional regulator